jgi:ribosomal-protein-alanine N-acetyltransferase
MLFHLETERLILRDLRITDVDSMFELDSNPVVHKYLGNTPITNKEQAKIYVLDVIKQYNERGIGRWALIHKETNEFMGWSGLRHYNENEAFNGFTNFYDVGYRLIPKYWGKGYATESGKAAIDYAFNTLKLETVYGITEMENEASHKALLKIGLNYIEDFNDEKESLRLRWYKIENS